MEEAAHIKVGLGLSQHGEFVIRDRANLLPCRRHVGCKDRPIHRVPRCREKLATRVIRSPCKVEHQTIHKHLVVQPVADHVRCRVVERPCHLGTHMNLAAAVAARASRSISRVREPSPNHIGAAHGHGLPVVGFKQDSVFGRHHGLPVNAAADDHLSGVHFGRGLLEGGKWLLKGGAGVCIAPKGGRRNVVNRGLNCPA